MVPEESIRDGTATDAYFLRTETTLEAAGKNPHVVAEVTADQFPTGEFELLSGVKDAARLLEGLPIDVDAMAEGRLFDGGPVMSIEGRLSRFRAIRNIAVGLSLPRVRDGDERARCATRGPRLRRPEFRRAARPPVDRRRRRTLGPHRGARRLFTRRRGRGTRTGTRRNHAPRPVALFRRGQSGGGVASVRRGRRRGGATGRAL